MLDTKEWQRIRNHPQPSLFPHPPIPNKLIPSHGRVVHPYPYHHQLPMTIRMTSFISDGEQCSMQWTREWLQEWLKHMYVELELPDFNCTTCLGCYHGSICKSLYQSAKFQAAPTVRPWNLSPLLRYYRGNIAFTATIPVLKLTPLCTKNLSRFMVYRTQAEMRSRR